MTMSLVRGRNYCGVCQCIAISTLVREGGVGFSFGTQNPFFFLFLFLFFFKSSAFVLLRYKDSMHL